MTTFSRILGQSWKVKFHKVKLLKFKTFNFDLKFCWNWSFFHYEKIMRFKKVLSYLELEGQGRGIIMKVTPPRNPRNENALSKMISYNCPLRKKRQPLSKIAPHFQRIKKPDRKNWFSWPTGFFTRKCIFQNRCSYLL